MIRIPTMVLIALLVLPVSQATSQQRYTVTDLGEGSFRTETSDMGGARKIPLLNNRGEVVSYDSNGAAYLWSELAGRQSILSTNDGVIYRLNNVGQVWGDLGAWDNQPFLWSSSSGITTIPTDLGQIANLTDDGEVLARTVVSASPFTLATSVWSPDSEIQIVSTPANFFVFDRNGPEQYLGLTLNSSSFQVALWSAMDGLKELGGGSTLIGLTEGGDISWNVTDFNGNSTYFWSEATGVIELDPLAGMGSIEAFGMNNFGEIVGKGPFYWNLSDGTIDLNNMIDDADLEWELSYATSINDLGQIVGIGTSGGSTEMRTLLLTPTAVPEMSSWLLSLVGLSIGICICRLSR